MSAPFVITETILDRILARKVEEIAERRAAVPLEAMIARASTSPPSRDFVGGLYAANVAGYVALIAEVKKASPSKGVLIDPFDPLELARTYADNGAAALSVLTDMDFFQGHLDYLTNIHHAVGVPLLRKDFIIDPYQVYEAHAARADAVLLIAAALEDAPLRELHRLILSLGMAALVEVHDELELSRALAVGATLIGVNNRDLRTFHEDLGLTERIAARVPAGITLVAESAIRIPDDLARMAACGAHAVLIGEGLVKAGNIGEQVRQFSHQTRPVHAE